MVDDFAVYFNLYIFILFYLSIYCICFPSITRFRCTLRLYPLYTFVSLTVFSHFLPPSFHYSFLYSLLRSLPRSLPPSVSSPRARYCVDLISFSPTEAYILKLPRHNTAFLSNTLFPSHFSHITSFASRVSYSAAILKVPRFFFYFFYLSAFLVFTFLISSFFFLYSVVYLLCVFLRLLSGIL